MYDATSEDNIDLPSLTVLGDFKLYLKYNN